jgi:DUF1680 family protein
MKFNEARRRIKMDKKQIIKSVPINSIKITDPFWKSYMESIRLNVIPYLWAALNDQIEGAEPSYCMQNFKVASGKIEGRFQGMVFQDSDVYKWLEGVAYSLMWHPDPELEAIADSAIEDICAASQPDGYLNTYYIINGLEKRFTNLKDNHELYCLGHMIEGAVAYYEATGKRKLLDVTIKYADFVDSIMGPEKEKGKGYPGHEVVEMALVKLYHLTDGERFLKLAKYFVDQRGKKPLYFEEETEKNNNTFPWENSYFKYQYYQAGKPVAEQKTAEGHAVRAVYLYSGMADVAKETNDVALLEACDVLWDNITQKQMYITGGIGSSHYGESFTYDYDLPNDTIYAETCASVGMSFFAKRMFESTKDSKYTDVLERELYNGTISGMSLDGKSFFYVNPLEVVPEASEKDHLREHVKVERQKWFGCACCPPNLARLISSIGGYAYETNDEGIFMNLYIGGLIETNLRGIDLAFQVETNYPWDEEVEITIETKTSVAFKYAVRIPGWCKAFEISLNGKEVPYTLSKGYAYIDRTWENQDQIILTLKMPITLISANPHVREDIGKVAVTRGPLVYCLEEEDNGKNLHKISLPKQPVFTEKYEEELLKGIVTIECDGLVVSDETWDEKNLYQSYEQTQYEPKKLKWIPYYAWTNRTPGEMVVWVRI